MRWSQYFIPTLREDPADAEVVSHRLLLRAGFIRQLGAGIYSFLPLGWRVAQRATRVVREEMERIGAQEFFLPAIHPRHTREAADRLGGFDRPALIAWSREDRFFPSRHAEELAGVLPAARLEWIDDSYTFSPEDQPERLAGLIGDFIRATPLERAAAS